MSYVMGIDPSITATGVCLIHDKKEPEYHTIGTKSGQPLGSRLWHLSCLLKTCMPTGTSPLLIAIETPISPLAMGKAGGRGFNNNIMAYAMAYEMMGKFKIPYIELSPHQLKMVATGSGSGKKELVIAAYDDLVKGTADNNNEIDAYWLAYAAAETVATRIRSSFHLGIPWLELSDKTYDMLENLEIQYP